MASPNSVLSAGKILRAILLEDEGVCAITRKIFPVVLDSATLPYIFYRRTALLPVPNSNGSADTAQIELLCCAESYEQSLELAEAVRAALNGVQGRLDGMTMRSCWLSDSEETLDGDAFAQSLIFTVRIN